MINLTHVKVEIQKEWYSVKQCKNNPNKLYIFGDNFLRIGKGGQAIIRDCNNSFGIATKKFPTMKKDAFMSDKPEEAKIIFNDINDMINGNPEREFDTIVLPAAGLGTGLSKMPELSPKLFNWLNDTLSNLLGIDYHPY